MRTAIYSSIAWSTARYKETMPCRLQSSSSTLQHSELIKSKALDSHATIYPPLGIMEAAARGGVNFVRVYFYGMSNIPADRKRALVALAYSTARDQLLAPKAILIR